MSSTNFGIVARTMGVLGVSAVYRGVTGKSVFSMSSAKQYGMLGVSAMVANIVTTRTYLNQPRYLIDAVVAGAVYSASNYVLKWQNSSLMNSFFMTAGMVVVGEPIADGVLSLSGMNDTSVMDLMADGFVPNMIMEYVSPTKKGWFS